MGRRRGWGGGWGGHDGGVDTNVQPESKGLILQNQHQTPSGLHVCLGSTRCAHTSWKHVHVFLKASSHEYDR